MKPVLTMLRPPSLLGGQTSGFVPFGAGGSAHGDLDEAVATPAPTEPGSVAWRQGSWMPAASGRVRVVEAAVLAAIGGYFSLALVKLAGWL